MISGKIKKWGNSYGLLIPKKEMDAKNLHEDQEVVFEVTPARNPLKELFGFGKKTKIEREKFLQTRKTMESKFF